MARADAVGLADHVLVTLARAGAFRTLWPCDPCRPGSRPDSRREALWEVLRRLRARGSRLGITGRDGALRVSVDSSGDSLAGIADLLGKVEKLR